MVKWETDTLDTILAPERNEVVCASERSARNLRRALYRRAEQTGITRVIKVRDAMVLTEPPPAEEILEIKNE